jgi:hypothetical protein
MVGPASNLLWVVWSRGRRGAPCVPAPPGESAASASGRARVGAGVQGKRAGARWVGSGNDTSRETMDNRRRKFNQDPIYLRSVLDRLGILINLTRST